jgi:small-conductance mechanosensitive channel
MSIAALAAVVFFHGAYDAFTAKINMPEIFEHTIYRTAIAYFVVEILRQIILLVYRTGHPERKRDNFVAGVGHIITIVYFALGIVLLLALFNISVKEAITTLSLIAAAVVLMTKDYISNLINGMYLTFTKVITIGDQVNIDGVKGKILDITLTNVHLLNDDDDLIYIPNNKVFSGEIINYTRRELKKTSIEFEVDPLLVSDISKLEQRLIEELAPHMHEIQPGTCNLKVVALKKEVIQLKFQFILVDPLNKELDKKVRRFVIRKIVSVLNADSFQ